MILTSNDNHIHRTRRLEKTLRLAALIGDINRFSLRDLLTRLDDHKGHLSVHWVPRFKPSAEIMRAFAVAWEINGEAMENVSHIVDLSGARQ